MSTQIDLFRQMSDEEVEQLIRELKSLRSDNQLMKKLLTIIEKIKDLLENKLTKCLCNQSIDTKIETKLNVLSNRYEELKHELELDSSSSDTRRVNHMIVVQTDQQNQQIIHSLAEQQSHVLDDSDGNDGNDSNDSNDNVNNEDNEEVFVPRVVTHVTRSEDKPNIIYINVDNIEAITESAEPSVESIASDGEEVEEEADGDEEQYEYSCEYSDVLTGLLCRKKFMTRASLVNHVVGHSGQRPWFCEVGRCGYRAVRRSHLIGHMRKSHTGRFQFRCDWPGCDFKGPSRYNVKRHKIIHTGEKPYKCDWPGCEFRSPNNKIADHKRIHTGERPYACNWVGCEARFSRPFTLRNHERTHTGEKPFVCDYPNCEYRSTQQTPLATHKRKHHSLGNVASEEVIITDNVITTDD